MAKNIDFSALLDFLEESLKDKKDEIKSLNKYCKNENENSFLYNTYHFLQLSKKDDIIDYMVVVFQDLPYPYPTLILQNIKAFMDKNQLKCEYQTWKTYEDYNNPK